MRTTQKIMNAAILSASLAFATAAGAGSGMPVYPTPEKAQAQLDRFCSPGRMKTRTGQAQCLQETAGQTNAFAEKFHAALFAAVDLPSDKAFYKEMIAAWDKKLPLDDNGIADRINIHQYANLCGGVLVETIQDPDATLDFSYTTGYSVAKYCVDTAKRLSEKYNLPINQDEAARLSHHIAGIYDYYAANPDIPPRKDDTWEEPTPFLNM